MINGIYKVNYMAQRGCFTYVGLLRNEKRFNINDQVFFSTGNGTIFPGTIVGVDLEPYDNQEYKYKIRIKKQ